MKKRRHFYVGRGPVPRHAAIAGDRPPRYGNKNGPWHRRAWALGCHTHMREGSPRHAAIAGDRPPRYGNKNGSWHPRGPRYGKKNATSSRRAWALGCHTRMREGSPRHAAIAGETRSDARMASEGPRATVKKQPAPDPFEIRRSRTTEVGFLPVLMWCVSGQGCPSYRENIKTPANDSVPQ